MLGVVRRVRMQQRCRGRKRRLRVDPTSPSSGRTLKTRMTRMTASVVTDSVGRLSGVRLPPASALFVQAQSGANEQSASFEERIGEAGVLGTQLVLGDSNERTASASGAIVLVHRAGWCRRRRGDRARPIATHRFTVRDLTA